MYLQIGTYQHAVGRASASTSRDYEYNDVGQVVRLKEKWNIQGYLMGTGPSDIATQVTALKQAYSTRLSQAGLYLDDGTSAFTLNRSNGPIRILSLGFPSINKGQFTTFLDFTAVLECDFDLSRFPDLGDQRVTPDTIVRFRETVSYQNRGGPRFDYHEPVIGRPQRQQTQRHSLWIVSQTGNAVGYGQYPPPPRPLWPNYLVGDGEVTEESPEKRNDGDDLNWPITWSYQFKSHERLIGHPNRWIGR